MKESATYQAILEEGAAQGAAREARRWLLRLGQKRFGQPDQEIIAAVEAITDVRRLEELGDRLDEVDSWEALLRPPARRPRSSRRRGRPS